VFWGADPSPSGGLVHMAAEGKLQVPITKTYTFDQLPEALGLVGSRSSGGQVRHHDRLNLYAVQ
jgi:hypothetical protein